MNNTIQALGWTLIHFCWQAAAVAAIYRLIDAAFSRSRSHLRYLLALSAVMSLLVVAAATLAYEQKRVSVESMSYALVASDGRTIYAQPACDNTVSSSVSITNDSNTFSGIGQLAGNISDAFIRALPGDLLSWIDAIWLAGVMALSVRLFGGWMTVRRLQSSTKANAPLPVYAAFLRLADKMGISRRVNLLVCQRIAGPVAIGVFRAVIILPASALSHLSPEQLEVVLAHELAHIRRADYLWNMLQTIVETLFFFHPAVWWLGNRTRQMRELCCDDEALAACGDPVVYATALLQLEEQRSVRVRLAMAFHGNGGSLKSRILRILDGGQSTPGIHRRDTIPLSLAGVAATLGIFLLPLPHVIAGRAAVVEQKPAIAKAQAEAAPQITQAKPKMAVAQSQRQEPTTPPTANEVVMPAAPVAPAFVPEITVAVPTSPTISVQIPVVPVVAIAPRVMTLTGVEPRIVINTVGITRTLASVRRIAVGAITTQARTIGESAPDKNYMEGMYALGYTDIDKIIAMKVQGITLDYAKRMSGYGAASADDLIALKTFGVTPEEADKLHAEGGGRTALKELVRYKIFKVTPEFVSEMKSAGFGELPPDKLVALRVQGVTPAFASSMRQRYPQITVDQLVQAKIFRIDDDFIATAKSHGFDSLSLEKLIRLRVSGVLDDNSVQR